MHISCRVCGRSHNCTMDFRHHSSAMTSGELNQLILGAGCYDCLGIGDHSEDVGERKLLDARWEKSIRSALGPLTRINLDPVRFWSYNPSPQPALSA